MISIIAVGISKYDNAHIDPIPCAINDARNIYSILKYISEEEFSEYYSICLRDLCQDEFLTFLKAYECLIKKEDLLVIYFSGHAEIYNDDILLMCSDAKDRDKGKVSGEQLKQILLNYCGRVLIILDCCYSEAALSIANKHSLVSKSNITVVSSSRCFETATFCKEGSDFTNALCKTIISLYENGEDISVNCIASKMFEAGIKCYVNIAQGEIDCVIHKNELVLDNYADFTRVYLSKLNSNNRHVREMMWYSLGGIPVKNTIEILNTYIDNANKVCEADWLVRRAIGEVVSNIKESNESIDPLIKKMISSNNWMLQTIGFIACRNCIDKNLANYMCTIIEAENTNMSLLWLIDLYYSDSKYANVEVSLRSNLAKTSWGLIQIWDRYVSKYSLEELYSIFAKHINNDIVLEQLRLELFLRYKDNPSFASVNFYDGTFRKVNSKLLSELYSSNPRGRTKHKQIKWLMSIMFGNWRGYLSVDLEDYFNNINHSQILHDLELLMNIPSPEKRACIFSYLQSKPDILDQYKEELLWGLKDPHPWVRREAVLAYKNYKDKIRLAFDDVIDRKLYIGVFDLAINASRYLNTAEIKEYISKYTLTSCERASLLLSIENE